MINAQIICQHGLMSQGIDLAEGGGEERENGTRNGTLHVFISYASRDTAFANDVAAALEGEGVKCWIAPRDVTPGAQYASEIVHGIDSAKALVLILSEDAAASPHVLREIERATSKRHPIVTLRLDRAPLPAEFEYFLNSAQWLDASGGDPSRMIPKLIAAVKRVASAPAATQAAALTPDASAHSAPTRSRTRVAIVVVCVVGLAIVGIQADRWWVSSRQAAPTLALASLDSTPAATAAIPEKSLAVLPFVDMSEHKDQEYFSDGLSEELIDMLAKVPDLKVPARTSSFYFKGKQTTIAEIAKALGVTHVLEGSVRKSGNKLRVTAQLIRVDNGYHVWSETFDRQLDDVFKIQDDIAGAVVSSLKSSLVGEMPTSTVTRNTEAYTLYLRARALDNNDESIEQLHIAADYLRKAVALDPAFVDAWTQLVLILCHQVRWFDVQPHTVSLEAHRAIERVLTLGPETAHAHAAMAQIHMALDKDVRSAAADFARAHELDPADADNTRRLGDITTSLTGDVERAIALYLRAIELDPVNFRNYWAVADCYSDLGRFSDAEAAYRKTLELEPATSGIHGAFAFDLAQLGRESEALAEIQKEAGEPEQRFARAWVFTALGRKTESAAELAAIEQRYAVAAPFRIAELLAYRGDVDQAFVWLDRARVGNPEALLSNLKSDFAFRRIRTDPRFKVLLRNMNLPE